jgi:hypothetical protein
MPALFLRMLANACDHGESTVGGCSTTCARMNWSELEQTTLAEAQLLAFWARLREHTSVTVGRCRSCMMLTYEQCLWYSWRTRMLSSKFSARGELQRLSSVKGSDLPGCMNCMWVWWEAKRQFVRAMSKSTKRLRTSHCPKPEPRMFLPKVLRKNSSASHPAQTQVTIPMSRCRQPVHR